MLLLLGACAGSRSDPKPHTGTTSSASLARQMAVIARAAPCVPAAIHHGPPPPWTAAAWSDSSPGFTVPYALASHNAAAAFFFARKLRAGHPTNPANKVLWVVRLPRDGHPLMITARLSTNPGRPVRTSWPANSSPGEIYPSGLDLPKPGCWRIALTWGNNHANLDIQVHRAT